MHEHLFFKKQNKGWMELICGPMFAGKTEELLRKLKRLEYAKVNYVVFKPKIDKRARHELRSRNGAYCKSFEVDKPGDILTFLLKQEHLPKVIAIDEAQFFDESLIDVCELLVKIGFVIYISALDKNFRNEPFITIAKLLCYADVILKLSAICPKCGNNGTITQKITNNKPSNYDSPTIEIGDYNIYTVRCRWHHIIPNKPINDKLETFVNAFNLKLKKIS